MIARFAIVDCLAALTFAAVVVSAFSNWQPLFLRPSHEIDLSSIGYVRPSVPQEFRISHPLSISFDHSGHSGTLGFRNGDHFYNKTYKEGWYCCQLRFCFDDDWRKTPYAAPMSNDLPAAIGQGHLERVREDGFLACRSHIEALLRDQPNLRLSLIKAVWPRYAQFVIAVVLMIGYAVIRWRHLRRRSNHTMDRSRG